MYFVPRVQVTQYTDPGSKAFEMRSLYAQDIIVRFAGDASAAEGPIRRVFAEINPNLPIIRIQSLEAATASQFSQETLLVQLTSLFGLTALLLASIGLYGVTAYSVEQRTKEIGIRVALGADRKAVVKMVLSTAYALVGIGLAIGIPFALAMGRVAGNWLYGTNWYNPTILLGAAMALALSALIASVVPARRAASVSPMRALRGE